MFNCWFTHILLLSSVRFKRFLFEFYFNIVIQNSQSFNQMRFNSIRRCDTRIHLGLSCLFYQTKGCEILILFDLLRQSIRGSAYVGKTELVGNELIEKVNLIVHIFYILITFQRSIGLGIASLAILVSDIFKTLSRVEGDFTLHVLWTEITLNQILFGISLNVCMVLLPLIISFL